MKKFILGILICVSLTGCISDDYQYVNSQSVNYYSSRGFKILGYQGYNMLLIGRCYWYTLQRENTIYESCLLKWGDEIHEYNLKAINALRAPN